MFSIKTGLFFSQNNIGFKGSSPRFPPLFCLSLFFPFHPPKNPGFTLAPKGGKCPRFPLFFSFPLFFFLCGFKMGPGPSKISFLRAFGCHLAGGKTTSGGNFFLNCGETFLLVDFPLLSFPPGFRLFPFGQPPGLSGGTFFLIPVFVFLGAHPPPHPLWRGTSPHFPPKPIFNLAPRWGSLLLGNDGKKGPLWGD